MTKKNKTFLEVSQKKIGDLKRKLQTLTQKESELEKEERQLLKQIDKPMQEVRVSLSIESVFKSAFAILGVIALVYLLVYIKSIIII